MNGVSAGRVPGELPSGFLVEDSKSDHTRGDSLPFTQMQTEDSVLPPKVG